MCYPKEGIIRRRDLALSERNVETIEKEEEEKKNAKTLIASAE